MTSPTRGRLALFVTVCLPAALAGSCGDKAASSTPLQEAPTQVVLTSPADASSGVPTDVTLEWQAAERADHYDVFLGTTNPPLLLQQGVSGTSFPIAGLDHLSTYYWRVDAVGKGGSTAGNVWHFETVIEAPADISGVTPADLATNVPLDVVLDWDDAARAESYDVWFGPVGNLVYVGPLTTSQYAPAPLNGLSTYAWRIQATNAGGSSSEASGSFTTTADLPAVVAGITPADGAGNVAVDATLDWNDASGATGYHVWFGATNPPPAVADQTTSQYSPGLLSNSTMYYWKISAFNTQGASAEVSGSFTTVTEAPAAVINIAPADGTGGVPISAILSWDAAARADGYNLSFGTSQPPPSIGTVSTNSYDPGGLNYLTTYYWTLSAFNAGGTSTEASGSFTTIIEAPAPITGVLPIDGATSVPVATLLDWDDAARATSYDVWFGTTDPPPSVGNQPSSVYDPGTLSYLTTYYWQIVANNAGGTSAPASGSFTVAEQPPGDIAYVSIDDGATNIALDATLLWSGALRADDYDVWFGTDPDPSYIGNQTTTMFDPGGLAYLTTYYWRIVANNTGGSSNPISGSFTTVIEQPGPIGVVTPSDGTVDLPITTNLTWGAAARAAGYHVWFGESDPPPYAGTVSTELFDPGPLYYYATYYWQLVAYNDGGESAPVTGSFRTENGPPRQVLQVSPAKGRDQVRPSMTLKWERIPNALGYDLYFGDTSPPPYVATLPASTTWYDPPGDLAYATRYDWNIRAYNAIGSAADSTGWFLTKSSVWQAMGGGSGAEAIADMKATSDGGCILVGSSTSTDLPTLTNAGGQDVYVVKLDASGALEWQKLFGGSLDDTAASVWLTSDGGYVVAGTSRSADIPGLTNHGLFDIYLIKLDAAGAVEWQGLYGGNDDDRAASIVQLTDNRYAVVGDSYSTNWAGINKGNNDLLVMRVDSNGAAGWAVRFGGAGFDYGGGLRQDYTGNIIAVGSTRASASSDLNILAVKLTTTGGSIWQQTFGGNSEDGAYGVGLATDGGYLIAGRSQSNNLGATYHGGGDLYVSKITAAGGLAWQNLYGGTGNEYARSIEETAGGDILVAGYSASTTVDGLEGHGSTDFFVLKLDQSSGGSIIWEKLFGGSDYDAGYAADEDSEGSIFVAGYSSSGDIRGTTLTGGADYYVLKLSSRGNLDYWLDIAGGQGSSERDVPAAVAETCDGGYIVVGYSGSTSIPGLTNHGGMDAYAIRYNAVGDVVWQQLYGGGDNDFFWSVEETSEGSFLMGGHTASTDIPGITLAGSFDSWVVKLKQDGSLDWQTNVGGSGFDSTETVIATTDGGAMVHGYSNSTDLPATSSHGGYDIYLARLNPDGTLAWYQLLGGGGNDYSMDIQQTSDGGFILVGGSTSTDIPTLTNSGGEDVHVVRLNSSGSVVWQKLYGGSGNERAYSVRQTTDLGFIVAGSSRSTDIAGTTNKGSDDVYVLKLDSVGDAVWQAMYGGSASDAARAIRPTTSGGYLVAGSSATSFIGGAANHGGTDAYVLKLNATGAVDWQQMYGRSSTDIAFDAQQTSDGGFIIAAESYLLATDYDYYIIKLDADFNGP